MIEPIVLSDAEADYLTRSQNKRSLAYAHYDTAFDVSEIAVHYNICDPKNPCSTVLYIKDSQFHHRFFNAFNQVLWPHQSSTIFPLLKMTTLNEWIDKLHNDKQNLTCKHLWKLMGDDYHLPTRFDAVYFPMPEYCVTIIDPKIIRCCTRTQSPQTIRLSLHYRVVLSECQFSTPNVHMNTTPARNFEMECNTSSESPWPHLFQGTSTHPIGMACFETKIDMVPYCDEWVEYVSQLQKQDYRNATQLQSKHIPNGHGRTLYGHYMSGGLRLWLELEELLVGLLPSKPLSIATCDIAVKQ